MPTPKEKQQAVKDRRDAENNSGNKGGEQTKMDKVFFIKALIAAILIDLIYFLVGLTGLGDFVMAILVTAPATLFFWVWYKMNGISFNNPKRMLTGFGVSLDKFIPFLNMLPAFTAGVLIMYGSIKAEDQLAKNGGIAGKVASQAAKK